MHFEFQHGSGVVIGPDCYRFAERIRDKHRTPLFRHVQTEEPRMISDRDIGDMIARSEVQILTPGELAEMERTGKPPRGPNLVTVDDIKSKWERGRASKYEPYLQGWVRAGCPPLSDGRLSIVIGRVADEQGDSTPPHPRTLRRFIGKWVSHGQTLDGVVSNKSRCGARSSLGLTVRELVLDVIWNDYLTLERPSASDCYEILKRKILDENHKQAPGAIRIKLPSLSQFRREIGKLDAFTVAYSRQGPRAAMADYGPKYTGVDARHHNFRWELDSTVADLMLIDADTKEPIGRPTVTMVIDCYTRYIVGFYIGWESEGFATFVAAMEHALQSKAYIRDLYPNIRRDYLALGPPVYVAVDNHSAYVGNDCKNALKTIGVDIQYTPVLKAWWRPIVERMFNTLTHKLFQRVPGTTFSNIFERNKEVVPTTIACATLDELRAVVTRWVVDEYHYSVHRGIKQPPAMLWDESTRLRRTVPPPSRERMAIAFSKVETRKPQTYGLEVETMLFNSADVANAIIAPGGNDEVRVAINYRNLNSIGMFNKEQKRWVQIPRVRPPVRDGHALTWAEFTLEKELRKARVREFIEGTGFEPPHDSVAQWVAEKRSSKSMTDRRRGERFYFKAKHEPVKRQPVVDIEASDKPVSDSIFGGAAELPVAPVPHGHQEPSSDEPTAGESPSQMQAESKSRASADDLRAVAARLGITTHRKE